MYSGKKKQKEKFWLRDIAAVEMFFSTGARVYEISNLTRESVDLNLGVIRKIYSDFRAVCLENS